MEWLGRRPPRIDSVRHSLTGDHPVGRSAGREDTLPEPRFPTGCATEAMDRTMRPVRLVCFGIDLHGDLCRRHVPPAVFGRYSMGLATKNLALSRAARNAASFTAGVGEVFQDAQTHPDGGVSQNPIGGHADGNLRREPGTSNGGTLFSRFSVSGSGETMGVVCRYFGYFGGVRVNTRMAVGVFPRAAAHHSGGRGGVDHSSRENRLGSIELSRTPGLQWKLSPAGSD